MRLYWHPFSIVPRRVRIAVREKGIVCDEVEVDLPGGALHGPAFRKLNPFGQVPVLEDGDVVIAESVAILEYLEDRFPEPALRPGDLVARARCREMMLAAGDYLMPAWKAAVAPIFQPDIPRDAPSVREGRDAVAGYLDVLETRLGTQAWLVGEYSLADICHAPIVTTLKLVGLDALLPARPAVQAWAARLRARPAVAATAL